MLFNLLNLKKRLNMTKYLPHNIETVRKFIYNEHIHKITVNFSQSNEVIPFTSYVEKTVDEDTTFTWYHLVIKLDIPKGGSVKVSLNHPHDPLGITTFDNMKFVAETCLENLIPELMKKNVEPIKQFL